VIDDSTCKDEAAVDFEDEAALGACVEFEPQPAVAAMIAASAKGRICLRNVSPFRVLAVQRSARVADRLQVA
jgi:hypothetical protein